MSLFPMATALVTWRRATAIVLEAVALGASHTADRALPREACVQVQLQGAPTGTVTVAGTVDGGADTEVLTWAGTAGFRVTSKRFTGSLTFTVSQTGGTTIQVKAVGAGGDDQLILYTVRGPGHPISIEEITEGSSPVRRQGEQEEGTHRLLVSYEEVWEPRRGDRVTNDASGDVYEVLRVKPKAEGGLWYSHWSCSSKMVESRPGL